MAERTLWNGKKYSRWPTARQRSDRVYFQRSIKGGVEYLHRAVWEHHNGPIPSGHHIHHVDGDPGNNSIENLECVTPDQHAARHPLSAKRLAWQSEHLARIRPLTKAWHASPEGIDEHRRVGAMAYAQFQPEPKRCAHCAERFTPRKIGNADLFCGNKCRAAARRASGVDDEDRACVVCGTPFRVNRYSKTQTCSRACGNRKRARTIKQGL